MPITLPKGDPEKTTYGTDMGALWRDDDNERLVRFVNYEDYDDYEVEVYWLDPDEYPHSDSDVVSEMQYWNDDTIEAFTDPDRETTAYLSGHNFAGTGVFGVFADGKRPNCPECGAFMSPGDPKFHAPKGQVASIGFTCKKYDRTNGGHAGFMRQSEAIDRGYYITIEQYLKRAYGEGK